MKPEIIMVEAVRANAGEDKRRRRRDLVLVTENRRGVVFGSEKRGKRSEKGHATPMKSHRRTDGGEDGVVSFRQSF